ncbi:MAG TPA: thiamine pyrophosphate-dependent enzyme [Cyclobacteriaceae bacterium]|nr:thiamine pyrophosphate-dependent enzyme [Cyclobacteriaceae bacterium]
MTQVKSTKAGITAKKATAILADYRLACESREASIIGRKEVFMGKAKFGIFGDGKEIPQIAMAKVFRKGDWRSGYYRDQTFMLAIGELTLKEYFAQLYAHTNVEADPASAGRLMNGHFATRIIDETGEFKKISQLKNSSADISPTAGQMPRLVGLAYASKLFKENPGLAELTDLSNQGNEVAFGTIGNASTSEGAFFEAINAAGVLQVPMLMAVWDDEYGISVPASYQTTKGSISKILQGFQRSSTEKGFEILTAKGWDYTGLCEVFERAEKICREEHVPVLLHVQEVTQPQGHSTSGSHERYKSKERLEWEKDHDCIRKMRLWIEEQEIATSEELDQIEKEAKATAREAKEMAWREFNKDIQEAQQALSLILDKLCRVRDEIVGIKQELDTTINPLRLDAVKAAKKAARLLRGQESEERNELIAWIRKNEEDNLERFSSHLYSQSQYAALKIEGVPAEYSDNSPLLDGREVLQACFDAMLNRDPRVFAIGEDVGKIGDVNQAFAGLQKKYGELRVTDTGIREATIIGQGIGAALRGLRPIAEIQYLDYLLYAIQVLSDDLACLQYRTKGGQKAPLIIRTRGHRLEGVWHSGSPMGMILHSLRGIHVLVPRNMTQAAGFYNTVLKSDEPALIIECLNGYRLKEKLPNNIGEFTIPLGIPEVLREGTDVTVVTYGSMCRIVMEAAADLERVGISVEVVDVQSLLPFDINNSIVESIKKTNRVVFADEDVPGGASAFMMKKVLEDQDAYQYLDSKPLTITAREHRPAYGSDGDYFSKPNPEEVFDAIYELMCEADPERLPPIY